MRFKVRNLWALVLSVFSTLAAPPGRFDSIDGTYDELTSFAFDPSLYWKALNQTWVGPLTRSGDRVKQMQAFGGPQKMDGTAAIWSKQIHNGDMVRFSLVEDVTGLGTYGDLDPQRGNYLGYGNMECRVNEVDSPGIPVPGRNSQRRVRSSLGEIKPLVIERVKNWAAQEVEIQATLTMIAGADALTLKGTADGGLADTLGIKSLNSASAPLMPRYVWTPDDGLLSYSSNGATWNSTVNDGVNNITTGANGRLSLAGLDKIRGLMDTQGFAPLKFKGKQYKAICIADSDLVWRLNHLLADYYKYATPRSDDNKLFGVSHTVEFNEVLYIGVPILKKFRLAYNAGDACPRWGVGTKDNVLSSDPRTTTNSNSIAIAFFLGAGGLLRGYDSRLWITDAEANHGKGIEYVAHQDMGWKRGEWFPQDGRTDTSACLCYGGFCGLFYEDGIGQGW